MARLGRYIDDNFRISDAYIEKQRLILKDIFPENSSNDSIRLSLKEFIIDRWLKHFHTLIINEQIEVQKNLIIEEGDIYLSKSLTTLLLNVIDKHLMLLIQEVYNPVTFKKELEIEHAAYYINRMSNRTPVLNGNWVSENTNPKKLLLKINDDLFSILSNSSLLHKIELGRNNPFILGLKDSKEYLKTVLDYGTSENALYLTKENELIIEANEIIKLKGLLDGLIWDEGIKDEDFISYWRLGAKSKYLPIKKGMQTSFIFVLYSYYIDNITTPAKFSQAQLEETFNITNIKSLKQRIKTNSFNIRRVKDILKTPKYDLKKQ